MNQHVPEDLLQSFVDADVDEQLAVHIAEHLDGCPSCSTRAAGLEPLGAAFAAATDPEPPPELAARILAAVDEPERLPVPQIALGLGLLGAAALLVSIGMGSPWVLAADIVAALQATAALGRGLSVALGSFQLALAATTAVTLAGALLTLRYAALPSPELRRIP
jgi:anti-sigma factor RsiW